MIYLILRNFSRYNISRSSLVYTLLQPSKTVTWPLSLVFEELRPTNLGLPIGFSVVRFQGTISKSHIVKNEIILKALQFIFKPVDKVKRFKRLFTMPSVFHELSNSSKLNIFCSPEWTTRGLHENEF